MDAKVKKKKPNFFTAFFQRKKSGNDSKSSTPLSPVLPVLDTTLTILVATIDGIPAPGLKGALGGLLAIIRGVKLHNQNADALQELEAHLKQLIDAVLTPLKNAGSKALPQSLQDRITNLVTHIAEINNEANALASRGSTGRFFNGTDDAQVISGLNAQLRECLDRFMGHAESTVIDRLPRAHAAFNSKTRNSATKCFEGTRVNLLRRIFDWLDSKDYDEPRIFWLNGLAGTGKTTIAHTVAERCHHQRRLGASFFFSRDVTDRSNSHLVFSTIAHQLATYSTVFRTLIAQALESDSDAGHANFHTQLQHLIIQPLRKLAKTTPSVIVVMDALDECSQEKDVADILKLLATELRTLPFPMKFFITSRPEHQIRAAFESELLRAISKPFILHDIETSIVQEDIEIFLRHRLKEIATELSVGRGDWPSKGQLRILAERAVGLFIFASTAIRFIEDENYDDPERQLNTLIEVRSSGKNDTPFDGLDLLYSQVLAKAIPETAAINRREQFQVVVGTIILLLDPLPLNSIEALLQIEAKSARKALLRLHSLLAIPATDAGIPRVLHPSFQDYLTSPRRCTLPHAHINPLEHHGRLAKSCLACMSLSLKRNICNLTEIPTHNSHVKDLKSRLHAVSTKELRYACLHWATHVLKSQSEDLLVAKAVEDFAYSHFLHWLEYLSLIDSLETAIPCIKRAQQCALHIYYSALPFVPTDTILYKTYLSDLDRSITLVAGGERLWDPLLRTIEGHEDQVRSVSFSLDGSRIVSGSWDFTVRIWDSLTGALLNTLQGHERDVKCATFSPDCSHIASSSEDETIRLWDVSTGRELAKLEAHDRDVTSVAFAPDMQHLVSGSEDATVRVWDWRARKLLATLDGHDHYVRSVAYSHDSTRIISGSEDSTVRIWDAREYHLIETLRGHTAAVLSAIFSPDSTLIISGGDETVRVWRASTFEHLATLSGHASYVTSVAMSLDSTRIVSGSGDQTVKLWDALTYTLLNTFPGHLTAIWSVAFSPDGSRCASGSGDRTVRLWDTSTETRSISWTNRASYITSVAYSRQGTLIVSGSENGTLQMWDASTHLPIAAIQAHSREITSLTFNHDGTQIASASGDRTVRLWATEDHKAIVVLQGHERLVRAVAFSADGGRLVTGSEDTTIRIWSSKTGDSLLIIDGHSSYVMSVGFSTDGSRIVSGSEDASVRVWDSSNGLPLLKLEGHQRDVMGVSFSPDDTLIASASEDKTLRLWEASTGRCLQTFTGHTRDLRAVAFSDNSKYIATGSEDMTARLWHVVSGLVTTFEGHRGYVRSVAFSPDAQAIISGSEDGTVRLWDAQTHQSRILESHSSAVTCVSFSRDDSMAVLGTKDGTVQLWSMISGALLASLAGHTRYVTSVAFSPDQRHSASSSADMTVRVWDVVSYTVLHSFRAPTHVVTRVAFTADSTHVISYAGDKVELYSDLEFGHARSRKLNGHVGNPVADVLKSYDLAEPWLSHEWMDHRPHTIWTPWEFRGHVWPSHTSRVLLASNQDKVVIIDFQRVA
ncbi:hypothetical protein H0H93_016700 [Arthromyces matolae]|nr:hypothetical protein H0H93_016700 [Arthromyces matolae]